MLLLGAADGSMTAYDQKNNVFVDNGMKKWLVSGEIGHLNCANSQVVVATSTGTIARYQAAVFPQDR